MLAFIVQARVGSTRLPNKILLPFFKGKSILELLISKLKNIEDAKVILATSTNKENDILEQIARQNGVLCFRGAENDVIQRFIDAAEEYGVNNMIRVCSDNPFLELSSIRELVHCAKDSNNDYISFNIGGVPSIKTHYGFWTEFVKLDALKKVALLTDEQLYHEHVTNYIYTHPDMFSIKWIDGPSILDTHPEIRLTIDTKEDFDNVKQIYSEICEKNEYPTIADVVKYLDAHSMFYASMRNQIKQNNK